MFIVLEGLVGSGKSSVVRSLSEDGWTALSCPSPPYREARLSLDSNREALEARHLLFLSALAEASATVDNLLCEGRQVVADTWHWRTQATHLTLGSRVAIHNFSWLRQPDLTFFIDCPDHLRAMRRKIRGTSDPYWKEQCEMRSDEIRRFYLENVPNLRTIDGSGALEDTVRLVKAGLAQ